MKLEKHAIVKKTVKCVSGVHIGGSKDNIEIGGLDLPIIKDMVTDLPYLPGSSIKGKMRSLLELKYCSSKLRNGEPCGCGEPSCKVCVCFGPHKNTRHNLGPTRFIFRDALLTGEWQGKLDKMQAEKGHSTEIKYENIVNRNKGTAEHPRPNERIPAGAEFDLEVSIRIFEGDNEKEFKEFLSEGFKLIQEDYLGGYGSRGSGKVEFLNNK